MKHTTTISHSPEELLKILQQYKQELHFRSYEDLIRYLEYLSKHEAFGTKELDVVTLQFS